MIPDLSRRALLRGTSALSAAGILTAGAFLLPGCTTQTSNGVTTITLNTAAINTDGSAVITAAQSVLAIPAVATLLGSSDSIVTTTLTTMKATMAAIAVATSGSASASINTANVQSLVTSLATDGQQFATNVSTVASQLTGDAATAVQSYVASITTLLSFVQVAASLAVPASAALHGMTEAQALQIALH